MSIEERRRRLAVRHCLAEPAPDIPTLARQLVGLHTSDPTTPFLAVRQRISDSTVEEVEQALYVDRSVFRMVGMRRTLFVITPDLLPLFDAACNRKNTATQRRRLAKLVEEQGIAADGERWIDDVGDRTVAVLERRGPTPGRELSALVEGFDARLSFGEGRRWAGTVSAGTRVLFILASSGRVIRAQPLGSWVSGQYRWAALGDWLGMEIEPRETHEAQRELLERWLWSHGPATLTDMQWWSGWTKTDTRRAVAAAGAVEVDLDGSPGFVLPDDGAVTRPVAPAAWFLPGLDPSVMGWKERDWFLGEHAEAVFDSNGNAGPTVWWDGRIVGGWAQPESAEVRFELLEAVPGGAKDAIESAAHELDKWLDGTRVMPRFPVPIYKRLAGNG